MLDPVTGTTRTDFTITRAKIEGVTIPCGLTKAERRFNILKNETDFFTAPFILEGQPRVYAKVYVGVTYAVLLYAAIIAFGVTLVADSELCTYQIPAPCRRLDARWQVD